MYYKLSASTEDDLLKQPETGMGYQIVKVILKSGKILVQHKVLNSELLILDENENNVIKDIDRIELESKK